MNEWEGTGYLILNPETGSGNYMISGGLSGGSTSTAVTIAGVCAVIAQIAMVAVLAVMMGSLLSALFGAALIVQVVYAVFLVMTLPSFLSMTARAGNLMEAVGRYAAGDTSYEEYILSEFLETTIDLAELVMYMAMFEFAMGKVLGGSGGSGGIGSEGGTGSGSGTGGSGSGSESGSGSGTGESGGDSGSSGVGESGTPTIITGNFGNEIDITPSSNHMTVSENLGPKGTPNSSVDILDSQGNIATRRWYDSEGNAYRDVDMTNHGNPKMHAEYPHEHTWDWSNGKPQRSK